MTTTLTQQSTLLDALDIESLLPEEQEELLIDLNALIFKGTLVRLIEKMDETTRDSFNELMDTDPSEEAIESFLSDKALDADMAVADTVKELTDDILAVTGASQN